MLHDFGSRIANDHAPRHAEVHDPLGPGRQHSFLYYSSRLAGPSRPVSFEVENDVLAHTPNLGYASVLQRRRDLGWRRFHGLRLGAEPDRLDDISGDTFVQSTGYSFDFGQFGHGRLVY